MMVNSGARRCGLVVLSAGSTERSTMHLCQIFEVTWLLCHPDLSGLRIYDLVLGPPTGLGSTSPGVVSHTDCAWAGWWLLASAPIGCSPRDSGRLFAIDSDLLLAAVPLKFIL